MNASGATPQARHSEEGPCPTEESASAFRQISLVSRFLVARRASLLGMTWREKQGSKLTTRFPKKSFARKELA
jgi:hypothetical protein